jgi:hypothetical protein
MLRSHTSRGGVAKEKMENTAAITVFKRQPGRRLSLIDSIGKEIISVMTQKSVKFLVIEP